MKEAAVPTIKELTIVAAIIIAFSLVSGALGVWSPNSGCAFADQPYSLSSLDLPLTGCFLSLMVWASFRVLVYPVLFVFALYYVGRALTASRKAILATLVLAAFVGAVLELHTTRQMSIFFYAAPDPYLTELFWFFLPQTVLTVGVTRFLLALGAVAMSRSRIGSG